MTSGFINASSQQAVLFADISDSTRLYELLGDARALAVISACLGQLQAITQDCRGRVVKTIGDEIMTVFPSAEAATRAARAMQLALAARAAPGAARIALRIGLHFGPVLVNAGDGDVFGDTVNVAARMVGIARADQIIASAAAAASLPPHMMAGTRFLDDLTVRGKAGEVGVFEVVWRDGGDMTVMALRPKAPPARQGGLLLRHGARELLMHSGDPALVLGRAVDAAVVIREPTASRAHARIEARRAHFVFIDESANGSYITLRGETEIVLRRQELLLRGSGVISFGVAYGAGGEAVEFCCLD